MKPIDASHAVVIELMEGGFSEAECIRAAQRFRGDRVAALDYLISKSDGELFCSDAVEHIDEFSCPPIETTRYVHIYCVQYLNTIGIFFTLPVVLQTLLFMQTLVTTIQFNF